METSFRERENVNYEGFQMINSWAGYSSFLDDIMLVVTNSVPYVAIAILLFLWFSGKNTQILERRRMAIYAALSSAMALLGNSIVHLVYYHPRPFVVHHVHLLVHHAADSSFVSDHAVLVFAIAWTIFLRKDRIKYPVFIWATIVAISRIYIGVHYPVDVIGSALLAFGTSALVIHSFKKWEPVIQFIFRLYNLVTKRLIAVFR